MKLVIVIEKGERNYSAYMPDIQGCVATGASLDEVKAEIHDSFAFHLECIRDNVEPSPLLTSSFDEVDVTIKAV